jgi:hypothetical protein
LKFRDLHIALLVSLSLFTFQLSLASDTVFVSGAVRHEGLLEHKPWYYGSQSYVDLSVHYLNDSNSHHFHSLQANVRGELTRWPMAGYEADFPGYGLSHLSLDATFDFGELTVGDVYDQFGSGLVLNIYEDRSLGIDGALRGAKIHLTPYRGLTLKMLGGKQRRYWECYQDRAFGWNYSRDAALGADLQLDIEQWSPRMQELDMSLSLGGSYVSKYQQDDTILTTVGGQPYRYHLPLWVGAGAVRAEWGMRGWNLMAEYAYKANDPSVDNHFSYRHGDALMASLSYSQKGLSWFAQVKRSDNMAFRSDRSRTGVAGRLNHMPVFAYQHTYTLAAEYPYATRYAEGEWAFQTELCYTFPRRTRMGGRYGTTFRLSASHIRGLASEDSWAVDPTAAGEYYTDVHLMLEKRLSERWWLNAMLMYQASNLDVIEGEGGMVRCGIGVLDARFHVNDHVAMRGELQYLYTPHFEGQWIFALYELELYQSLTLSGEWLYNIGHAPDAVNEHFYTAQATYTHGAHRLSLGYTKTREGMHCSGGICRYVPRQQGLTLNYDFNF